MSKLIIHSTAGAVLFTSAAGETYRSFVERLVREGTNLRGADLRGADLRGANLYGAYLPGANLSGANLEGAYLPGANLSGANGLSDLQKARMRITPADGEFTGWKKCRAGAIVRLRIPHDAKRSNAPGGRKCRAEFADVLEVIGAAGPMEYAVSLFDGVTKYIPGQRVAPKEWCGDPMQECAGGIHFYITREEAEAHE